ncbi:PAS domain S-box protein [Ideonella sp.]|uniref:hybrid sensor histidine kinase/response regulator n=1 Tax=Ideonella sp. TaxID=1929293 RepID=UPI0035B125ED
MRRRSWPVVVSLGTVIVLQVALAIFSIELMSAVRSYVVGESLYSKGQKDAQIHLLDYVEFSREEDYRSFLRALAAPLGDRAAREALDQPQPDVAAARAGFLAGGNHPSDIDGLVWLYRWFHDSSLMADAIASWKEGDQAITEMLALAESTHTALQGRAPSAEQAAQLRAQSARINLRLTELERRFSAQLATAARDAQRWVIGMNIAVAALLALVGLWIIRQSLHERESADLEIRRRQHLLQQLLDSAAEGLFGVDTEGRCTFINRSALSLLGYSSAAELVGRPMHALIHPGCAADGVRASSACRLHDAFLLREATHELGDSFRHRDGHAFSVEYWSYPMSEDGRPNGVVVTFFDISERLRTQEALRKSEVRLAKLIDTVADAVVSMDGSGDIVFFNRSAERIFRRALADTVGLPFNVLTAPASGAKLATLMQDLVRPVGASGVAPGAVQELTCIRSDGEEFPAEATVSKIEIDQGVLVTIVLRDVSEQLAARREREAREALENSSRAKTHFLSRMSHELRTPLNAVLGFAQLMSIDTSRTLDTENRSRVKHIEKAGSHLLALVNDVLDLSMVESGRLSLSLETVDARLVAEEALTVVAPLARDNGITLETLLTHRTVDASFAPADGDRSTRLDAFGVWVHADRVRLRQVLINLLTNAIKYNTRNGRVTLSLQPQGDVCQVLVADTGTGMTAEQLAHLFEPFNRLGAERSAVEGTGIGLVLTRQLVELMDGRLDIDSARGRGTTATVTLPRASTTVPTPRTTALPATNDGQTGPLDVLYAEDNEVNIELMRQVTKLRPSVHFRYATSGAEAMQMAQEQPPDLMLIDMNLGDTTGMQLAQSIRSNPATDGIHLVALSADALPGQIRTALDGGFENYLTKPINFIEILRVFDGYSKLCESTKAPGASPAPADERLHPTES